MSSVPWYSGIWSPGKFLSPRNNQRDSEARSPAEGSGMPDEKENLMPAPMQTKPDPGEREVQTAATLAQSPEPKAQLILGSREAEAPTTAQGQSPAAARIQLTQFISSPESRGQLITASSPATGIVAEANSDTTQSSATGQSTDSSGFQEEAELDSRKEAGILSLAPKGNSPESEEQDVVNSPESEEQDVVNSELTGELASQLTSGEMDVEEENLGPETRHLTAPGIADASDVFLKEGEEPPEGNNVAPQEEHAFTAELSSEPVSGQLDSDEESSCKGRMPEGHAALIEGSNLITANNQDELAYAEDLEDTANNQEEIAYPEDLEGKSPALHAEMDCDEHQLQSPETRAECPETPAESPAPETPGSPAETRSPPPPPPNWKEKIAGLYRMYNPEKIGDLGEILEKYSGSECELYEALCEKYDHRTAESPASEPSTVVHGKRRCLEKVESPTKRQKDQQQSPENVACFTESEACAESGAVLSADTNVRDAGMSDSSVQGPRISDVSVKGPRISDVSLKDQRISDVSFQGRRISDVSHVSSGKRPREMDLEETEPKRAAVAKEAELLCCSLASLDFGTPWSESLCELLVNLAPSALATGGTHDEARKFLQPLDKILEVEEGRHQRLVKEGRAKIESAEADKVTKEVAVEVAEAGVQAQRDQINTLLQSLAKDSASVREARAAFLKNARHVLAKEKTVCLAVKNNSLDPLEQGSWENSLEQKRLLVNVNILFERLDAEKSLLLALPSSLAKKPEDRTSFDENTVQALKELVSKHLCAIEEQLVSITGLVEEANVPLQVQDVTIEDAKILLKQHRVRMLAKEKLKFQVATEDSLKLLKEGSCQKPAEQHKHIALLSPLLKKLDVDKSLLEASSTVLKKKPDHRGDFENSVVRELETTFDKHIISIDEQLKENAEPEQLEIELSSWRTMNALAAVLAVVKKAIHTEAKIKKGIAGATVKEKEMCLTVVKERLEVLKMHSWQKASEQKQHLVAVTGLFQKLDAEESLLTAAISALQEKPEERSAFAQLAVKEFEGAVNRYLACLDKQITNTSASDVTEHILSLDKAQATFESAQQSQCLSAREVRDAVEDQTNLESTMEVSKKAAEESQAAVVRATENLASQEASLNQLQETRRLISLLGQGTTSAAKDE